MARVTVEDCTKNVDSLFDLVLLASHRAKAVSYTHLRAHET